MTENAKKDWLRRYIQSDRQIDAMLSEKEKIMSAATRMTVNPSKAKTNKAPRLTGNEDRLQQAVDKLCEMDAQIDREIDKLVEMRREIMSAIEKIEQPVLRMILIRRYITGESWEEVAANMAYNLRYVLKLHKAALSKLGKLDTKRHLKV